MSYQVYKREQGSLDPELGTTFTVDVQPMDKVEYKIINVMAMGTVIVAEEGIDLAKIEAVIPVTHPKYFPCVMYKVKDVAILIFRNGKMILTAITDLSVIPFLKVAIKDMLLKACIKFTGIKIEIQNIVVGANLGCRIDLEMACLMLKNCLYDPELFPAAIVKKYDGQRGTFLVFGNSKIIGLGFNSLTHLDTTIGTFVQELRATGLVV